MTLKSVEIIDWWIINWRSKLQKIILIIINKNTIYIYAMQYFYTILIN